MESEKVNTVQVQAYTPNGFRVYVNVHLMQACELDALMEQNGYLANAEGAKAGEDVETISHVALRYQTNNGGKTPHVAFYPENAAMEWAWVRPYLNTAQDIADFEAATGVILSSLPVYPADNHPKRKAENMNFIIQLPKPIKVVRKQVVRGTKDDGSPDKRNYFERYLNLPKNTIEPPQLSEGDFKRKLLELTHKSYTNSNGEHNRFEQENSLKKAFVENEINLDMDVEVAADIINTRKALG